MVLSSNANSLNDRWYPLESVFHEAMHQWDDSVQPALQAEAARQGVAPVLSGGGAFNAVARLDARPGCHTEFAQFGQQ